MIWIARHGRTKWNNNGKMQGRLDSDLTKKGIRQARQLAIFASELKIEKLICSPIGRAKKTAKIASEKTELKVDVDKRIKEIDIGKFSGKKKDEIKKEHPDFWRKRSKEKWNTEWPSGESYSDAYERATKFVEDRNLNEKMIISHRSINKVLVGKLVGLDKKEMLSIEQKNDVVLRIDNGKLTKVKTKIT